MENNNPNKKELEQLDKEKLPSDKEWIRHKALTDTEKLELYKAYKNKDTKSFDALQRTIWENKIKDIDSIVGTAALGVYGFGRKAITYGAKQIFKGGIQNSVKELANKGFGLFKGKQQPKPPKQSTKPKEIFNKSKKSPEKKEDPLGDINRIEESAAAAEEMAAGRANIGGRPEGRTGGRASGNRIKGGLGGKLGALGGLAALLNGDGEGSTRDPNRSLLSNLDNLSPVSSPIEYSGDIGDGYFNPADAKDSSTGAADGGMCCAKDILDKIYSKLVEIGINTDEISESTKKTANKVMSEDITSDVANVNRLARINEDDDATVSKRGLLRQYSEGSTGGGLGSALGANAGFLAPLLVGGGAATVLSELFPDETQTGIPEAPDMDLNKQYGPNSEFQKKYPIAATVKNTVKKVGDWVTTPLWDNKSKSESPKSGSMSPFKTDKKLSDRDKNMLRVYNAFTKAGYSKNQAKALTAEVGRENDYDMSKIFGSHTDLANAQTNVGMFSWQKDRKDALMKHLKEKGMIDEQGKMIQSDEALVEQAKFTKEEMKQKRYHTDKHNIGSFLENPDIDAESTAKLLGKGYIGWAYGQTRLKSGKPFDSAKQDQRRRNYSNRLSSIVDDPSNSLLSNIIPDDPELKPVGIQSIPPMPPLPRQSIESSEQMRPATQQKISSPTEKVQSTQGSSHFSKIDIPNVRNFDDPVQLQISVDNMWYW